MLFEIEWCHVVVYQLISDVNKDFTFKDKDQPFKDKDED